MFAFIAVSAMLISCSSDDDNENSPAFFNLAEGNLWVYKNYTVREDGTSSFSGRIDSIRVTGEEIIDGITYTGLTISSILQAT